MTGSRRSSWYIIQNGIIQLESGTVPDKEKQLIKMKGCLFSAYFTIHHKDW